MAGPGRHRQKRQLREDAGYDTSFIRRSQPRSQRNKNQRARVSSDITTVAYEESESSGGDGTELETSAEDVTEDGKFLFSFLQGAMNHQYSSTI